MVNLRLLQLLTVHIATKIKYQIMSKTSTIDFAEVFMICDNVGVVILSRYMLMIGASGYKVNQIRLGQKRY